MADDGTDEHLPSSLYSNLKTASSYGLEILPSRLSRVHSASNNFLTLSCISWLAWSDRLLHCARQSQTGDHSIRTLVVVLPAQLDCEHTDLHEVFVSAILPDLLRDTTFPPLTSVLIPSDDSLPSLSLQGCGNTKTLSHTRILLGGIGCCRCLSRYPKDLGLWDGVYGMGKKGKREKRAECIQRQEI